MKALILFILASLLIGFTQEARSQLIINTDKDTVNIVAGATATFVISIVAPKDFDASVFLEVTNTSSLDADIKLSTAIINAPYQNPVLLTAKTKTGFTKQGVYVLTISGKNGSLNTEKICFVKVSTTSPWKLIPNRNYYSPKFIVKDSNETYWYNTKLTVETQEQVETATYIFKKNQPIQWYDYTAKYNELSFSITNITIDKQNNKWLGTSGNGLIRSTDKYITMYNKQNCILPSDTVVAVGVDSASAVWVGTTKGLARLIGTEWIVFDTSNSVLGAEPITGIVTSMSVIWIGTRNGLVKYDGTTWTRYTPQNSAMPAPIVWSMAVEGNGTLWLGLGLHRVSMYKASNGYALFSQFSTFGGPDSMIGLAKFNGTTWTMYNTMNSPMDRENYINAISIDKKGTKWIATSSYSFKKGYIKGTGLLKFNDSTWTAYNTSTSPLPNNNIEWVGADDEDNIWFSSRDVINGGPWGVFNENGLSPFLTAPSDVVEQPTTTDAITITPNPSSATITISGTDNISAVTIVNSFGMEVVGRQTLSSANGSLNVDVSDLASGVYFVQLRTPAGMISKPIVVMH